MTYTEQDLNKSLGKLAMCQPKDVVILTWAQIQPLLHELCALRQATDCYDGSLGIRLANAVEARRKHNALLEDPPACSTCGAIAGCCPDYPNCPAGAKKNPR